MTKEHDPTPDNNGGLAVMMPTECGENVDDRKTACGPKTWKMQGQMAGYYALSAFFKPGIAVTQPQRLAGSLAAYAYILAAQRRRRRGSIKMTV